jgi:hypothetical protein
MKSRSGPNTSSNGFVIGVAVIAKQKIVHSTLAAGSKSKSFDQAIGQSLTDLGISSDYSRAAFIRSRKKGVDKTDRVYNFYVTQHTLIQVDIPVT